jgi:hypothetical protein
MAKPSTPAISSAETGMPNHVAQGAIMNGRGLHQENGPVLIRHKLVLLAGIIDKFVLSLASLPLVIKH